MKNQVLTRPYVTDLSFRVFDRSFHPELIEAVSSRFCERDGYRLTLHLTSAGHVVEYRRATLTIVEVLGDQGNPLPETRLLFAHRLGSERHEAFSPNGLLRYETCFQVERMAPAIFHRMQDELRQDGERSGVLHLLHSNDRLGFSPLSFVDLQARPNTLLIHAYHTFPEEHAIVKSQTLIETPSM